MTGKLRNGRKIVIQGVANCNSQVWNVRFTAKKDSITRFSVIERISRRWNWPFIERPLQSIPVYAVQCTVSRRPIISYGVKRSIGLQ